MVAVTTFRRSPKGRRWQMTDGGVWQVVEVWQAKFDGELVDPLGFYGDPLLPAVGDSHPENSSLRLSGVTGAAPGDNVLTAVDFTLTWDVRQLPPTEHDPDKYVDALRATRSWSHRIVQEPVTRAYVSDDYGTSFSGSLVPVANTVGDAFVPGLTRNRYLPVCRYSRNELSTPASVLTLPGTVNSDSFTLDGISVSARQAMILSTNVSAEKRFEAITYRTVDYEIMLREEGFDELLLNRGLRFLQLDIFAAAGVTPQWAFVRNGSTDAGDLRPFVFAQEPVTLNIDGQHLEYYSSPAPFGLGNSEASFVPHWRQFRFHNATAFTALGFT